MTDFTSLGIAEIREGLQAKQFTSVEVTKAAIARLKSLNHLNCFLEPAEAQALKFAADADARLQRGEKAGMLGVPIAIKDMIATRGTKTTCASKILQNYESPYDATVIRKLKEDGAVLLGKTNLDEFAMGGSNENSSFGPVKNPWNQACVTGGSSGGSAAAVAARIVPASLGTDTGGSIRQPASFCSLVGLKPTYGRVSRYGVVAFASSLDQVGPFARSVRDCAIVTRSISGHDPLDATSMEAAVPDFETTLGKDIKGLRVGIPKEYFIDGLDPEVRAAAERGIEQLESLGATLVEISLKHTKYAVPVYYVIAPAEASSNLSRFDGIRYGHRTEHAQDLEDLYAKTRSEGFGPEVKRRIMIGTYVLSSGYYDAYYLRAQKVRALIAKDFKEAFASSCDVIVSPTAPTPAFQIGAKSSNPLEMYLGDIFTIPANLAGLPGISLPCGFSAKGLPIGMQLVAKPWDEATLFQAAHAYESSTEWHKKTAEV